MRQIVVSISLFLASLQNIYSQQTISGVVNTYYKVVTVNSDYVVLDTVYNLEPGDKVVLIQMTGVLVNHDPGFEVNSQTYINFGKAGKYEMLAVKSVNSGSKQVDFTATITAGKFNSSEKIQLIKIYEADNATVTSTLTAGDWNGDKGGVLALVILKKLILNANIDVTAKGFLGADPEPGSTGICRTANPNDTFYFENSVIGVAGRKGEGNITKTWTHYKGPGKVVNGGGGGLGKFAGGGGGSNYGQGGSGGIQNCSFTPPLPDTWSADGGLFFSTIFSGTDRVTMGGGGGASTQDGTHTATKGGDGGGIVILLIDTLVGNGHSIISKGEPVTSVATAGGGGGGAGGSILADINVYRNSVVIDAKGGRGGSTGGTTGGGGGGGGGLFWFSGTSLSPNITYSFTGGAGTTNAQYTYGNGAGGTIGSTIVDLKFPLNGFLFNSINATDTICEGQVPKTITGSTPKGGPPDNYNWIQSTDSVTWINALGTGVGLTYFNPVALTTTTWYTRIVTSDAIIDTALPEKVFVYPVIADNLITIRDTICYGNSPGTLSGQAPTGGNSSFQYRWESKTDVLNWSPRGNNSTLIEGSLLESTYYRRIVTSAKVCTDTSNVDTITVIPLITNNDFLRADSAICEGLNAGIVRASSPGGGDNAYSYKWLESNDNISFGLIGGAIQQDYSPGAPASDKYYKRIAISGSDNACIDTSLTHFYLDVVPPLIQNSISIDSSRYCAGDIPSQITGSVHSGGDPSIYSFKWLTRFPSDTWNVIPDEAEIHYTPSTIFEDTVQLARVILSGNYDACKDTSVYVQVDVIPYIDNTLLSNDTSLCEGARPMPFSEGPATGGAGSFDYLWESKSGSSGTWDAASTEITANTLPAYSSGDLNITTFFRRQVTSQICDSTSNTITVTVYPQIEGNYISGGDVQYVCYNSSKQLTGSTPGGGKSGDRRYYWEESRDENIWNNAIGNGNNRDYNSSVLSDTNFYRRIVKSGENDQCIDTSSSVLIRINPLPSGSIESKYDTLCYGSKDTVHYYSLTGNGPWTIILGDQVPLYSQSGIINASGDIIFPVFQSSEIKILDIIDDSTCHAPTADVSGIVHAKVYEIPVANAGTDDEVCGENYTLNATPSAGSGKWTGSNCTFNNDTNSTSLVVIDASNFGSYSFTWTETNWQCSTSDDVSIVFYKQSEEAEAGDDMTLDYSFDTTLNAVPPLVGTGYWQLSTGIAVIQDPTLYNSRIQFDKTGDYILIWTVSNGVCSNVSDTIKITVGDLKIFTGFSPNDDGTNDDFIFKLSGRYTAELIILDSWGGIVFKVQGTDKVKWDGKNMDGKPVPEGTYYFILNEREISRTGYIELRR